jgi:AcrR family transcriptional regulator
MRDAILEKAEQQLMLGGYDKLNFASIAKELNTTRANLHYHFKNKETLAIEVVRKYTSGYTDQFKALRKQFNGNIEGFFNAVEDMMWMLSEDHGNDESKPATCINLVADPEIPEAIAQASREAYNEIESTLKGVIQDAIDNQEVRADLDAQREANRCHVLMMGISGCGQHLMSVREAKQKFGGIIMDWVNSLK